MSQKIGLFIPVFQMREFDEENSTGPVDQDLHNFFEKCIHFFGSHAHETKKINGKNMAQIVTTDITCPNTCPYSQSSTNNRSLLSTILRIAIISTIVIPVFLLIVRALDRRDFPIYKDDGSAAKLEAKLQAEAEAFKTQAMDLKMKAINDWYQKKGISGNEPLVVDVDKLDLPQRTIFVGEKIKREMNIEEYENFKDHIIDCKELAKRWIEGINEIIIDQQSLDTLQKKRQIMWRIKDIHGKNNILGELENTLSAFLSELKNKEVICTSERIQTNHFNGFCIQA
ncbi:MAG: hypothetical protein WCG42_05965 [Parachlamydiaceae bacterium]